MRISNVEAVPGGIDVQYLIKLLQEGYDRRDTSTVLTAAMNVILLYAFSDENNKEAAIKVINNIHANMLEAAEIHFREEATN